MNGWHCILFLRILQESSSDGKSYMVFSGYINSQRFTYGLKLNDRSLNKFNVNNIVYSFELGWFRELFVNFLSFFLFEFAFIWAGQICLVAIDQYDRFFMLSWIKFNEFGCFVVLFFPVKNLWRNLFGDRNA